MGYIIIIYIEVTRQVSLSVDINTAENTAATHPGTIFVRPLQETLCTMNLEERCFFDYMFEKGAYAKRVILLLV